MQSINARAAARCAAVLLCVPLWLPAGAADAPADPIEGAWQGTVTLPQGGAADIGLEFRRGADGKLAVSTWMPEMHSGAFTLGVPQRAAPANYTLDAFGTTVALDGDQLSGAFAFGKLPLALHRVERLPAFADAAQMPEGKPPAPAWRIKLDTTVWATPVVADGVVFIAGGDGSVRALRAGNGRVLWTHTLDAPLYAQPLVAADALYVVDDRAQLYRLDRKTGAVTWKIALDSARAGAATLPVDDTYNHRAAAPVLIGGVLYVGSTDRSMRAIDAGSGATLWRFEAPGRIVAAAAVSGERLFFGTYETGSVIALNRRDGRLLWTFRTQQPVVSAPVVAGANVVAGSRDFMLYALRDADGAVAWRHSLLISWVESVPNYVDGILYSGSSDLRAVRAIDAGNGATLWSTDVLGSVWGTPLVIRDTVYAGVTGTTGYWLPHKGSLVALDRRSGAVKWRIAYPDLKQPEWGIAASVIRAGDVIIVAGLDGTVAAYRV